MVCNSAYIKSSLPAELQATPAARQAGTSTASGDQPRTAESSPGGSGHVAPPPRRAGLDAHRAEIAEYVAGFSGAAFHFGHLGYCPAQEQVASFIRGWLETKEELTYPDLQARAQGYIDGYLAAWGA